MSFSVTTLFAALLWLSAPAPTAGRSLQDACADVRSSSMELNDRVKNFSAQAVKGPKVEIKFNFTLPWMEADDLCDPAALKHSSARCIGKILGVLRSYMTVVSRVAGIQTCSEFARDVKPPMEKLHADLIRCVKSRGAVDHVKEFDMSEVTTQHIPLWQRALLCNYTTDRLFSFSILAARVFAVGDPARHSQGSPHKCM